MQYMYNPSLKSSGCTFHIQKFAVILMKCKIIDRLNSSKK